MGLVVGEVGTIVGFSVGSAVGSSPYTKSCESCNVNRCINDVGFIWTNGTVLGGYNSSERGTSRAGGRSALATRLSCNHGDDVYMVGAD